jgi:hypothetical protein
VQFPELSNYPILQDKGKVSVLEAKLKAEGEYEVYRKRQDTEYISDFDREIFIRWGKMFAGKREIGNWQYGGSVGDRPQRASGPRAPNAGLVFG